MANPTGARPVRAQRGPHLIDAMMRLVVAGLTAAALLTSCAGATAPQDSAEYLELEAEVTAESTRLDSLDAERSSAESERTSANAAVNRLEESVAEGELSISSLREEIAEAEASIEAEVERIDELRRQRIDHFSSVVEELTASLTALEEGRFGDQ